MVNFVTGGLKKYFTLFNLHTSLSFIRALFKPLNQVSCSITKLFT